MAIKEEVHIVIILDDKKSKQGLKNTGKDAAKAGKTAGRKFSAGFSSAMTAGTSRALSNLRNQILAVGAVLVGSLFTRESISAAIEQEQAIINMNAAMRNAGDFSEQASKNFQDFASQLQSVTRFGDEVILNQISLAKAMGATNEEAEKLVRVATDLAPAMGVTLDRAVEMLGKQLSGSAGRLNQMVKGMSDFNAEQLKAGKGLDFLAAKFKGFAEEEVKSFGGALAQTKNIFGDLLEAIGRIVTKSPVMIKILQMAQGWFIKLTKEIDEFNKGGQGIVKVGVWLLDLVKPLAVVFDWIRKIVRGWELLISLFQLGAGKVAQALITPARAVLQWASTFQPLAQAAQFAFNLIKKPIPTIKNAFLEMAEVILDVAAMLPGRWGESSAKFLNEVQVMRLGVQKELEELESFGQGDSAVNPFKAFLFNADEQLAALTPEIEAFVIGADEAFTALLEEVEPGSAGADMIAGLKAGLLELGQEVLPKVADDVAVNGAKLTNNLKKTLTDAEKFIIQANKNIDKAIQTGIVNSVTQGINAMVTAFMSGENAWAAFGKTILGIIGDMAINIGTTLFSIGIGIEAIRNSLIGLVGFPAIAAGLVLISVGSLLKSLSGGKGNLGGSATTPVAPGQGAPTDPTLPEPPEDEERQGQAGAITVNISGDVLDSEDTSLRILDLINQGLEDQGGVIVGGNA